MSLREKFTTAMTLFGRRQRRTWYGPTRAHLELRTLDDNEVEALQAATEDAFGALGFVDWVEVNPYTRRLVVAYGAGRCNPAAVESALEQAEHRACCAAAEFCDRPTPYPSDIEPLVQLAVELVADTAGLLTGTVLRFSPLPASGLGGTIASALMIIKGAQRLRRKIDDRLGANRADLFMNLAIAAGNGLAQRPIVSLVDVLHKTVLWREAGARRELWLGYEPQLTARAGKSSIPHCELAPRPCDLPPGPIEEYSNRVWLVALSGFAFSFVATRSLQRAIAALFGGIPKPARLGRDVFSAELGRHLAARRILVLDPDALRRLDRVDCLVLSDDVITPERFSLVDVEALEGIDATDVRSQITQLFDPDRPLETRGTGFCRLVPLGVGANQSDPLSEHADEMARSGHLVIQLFEGEHRVAVGSVEMVPRTGLEELVDAAQRAELRVVIASNDPRMTELVGADDRIAAGELLADEIRRLQAAGQVVCTVASVSSPGLAASDCGIGLIRSNEAIPWGAHILCGEDLSNVELLLEATVTARQVAKQSVNIALAAASMGALVSAGGLLPLTSRRVVTVLNGATLVAMLNGVRASRAFARRPVVPLRDRTPWHALDARGVMRRLSTSEVGLSDADVARRRVGTQQNKRAHIELFEAVTDELFNPLTPLLAAGAGLSAVAGSMSDAAMVGGVVVLNAMVGGIQRFRTERRIRDLTLLMRRMATVHREGKIRQVPAEDLVVGDVVVMASGDVVPADCRILHAESVEVDTAGLTGESMPVARSAAPCFEAAVADRTSMLYAGTTIAAGRATGIVVATGDRTEAARGRTALRRSPPSSGVEQRLRSLINLTAPVALGAGVSLVGAGLLRGRRVEHLVPAGVSLAVASVPEGLPLLATGAQLAAARRLAQRGALVRNTRSIEALGRVDVLCFDKTGTLTEGRLELVGLTRGLTLISPSEADELTLGLLGTAIRAAPDPHYMIARDDPTDVALFQAAARAGLTPFSDNPDWDRESELPFEPGRGFHAVFGRTSRGVHLHVKGAPETVIERSTRWSNQGQIELLDAEARRAITRMVDQLARRGLRMLAVAERTLGADDPLDARAVRDLTFLGMTAFSDPVRPTAAAALQRLRRAGAEPLMVTGDHPRTAEAIADQLEILKGRRVMTGSELGSLSDDELDQCVSEVGVFARVTPIQKVRIVRSLQRSGRVVAMVGDGTNDAPAIRLAHVGVAVGDQSTSAARGAADIILLEERLETLVEAVIEGRAMWSSVRDAVSILVGGNLGEIGFTVAAGLVDGRPPLNPRQLLLVNLLTDVAPAMAIALRRPSFDRLESLASEGPEASLGRPLNRDIAARALITALGAGTAWTAARLTGSAQRASTVGLLALVGAQLGQTIAAGGMSRPVVMTSLLSTAALASIVQTPGVSQFFGCRPLTPVGWALAAGSSALATAAALAFPQIVSMLAARLAPVDVVMRQTARGAQPSLASPASVRAVKSVIENEGLLELVNP